MKLDFPRAELVLEPQQILRLHDAAGTRLRCLEGSVWITQSGDRNDHVVEAGEQFVLDREGTALINALTPSRIEIVEPAGARAREVAHYLASALVGAGRWIARHFGPTALRGKDLRGGFGAL